MKILHVINSLDIGGAESLLAGLLENWEEEHHVVVLQKPGPLTGRVTRSAVSVCFIGASTSSLELPKMILGLQRVVNEVRPDILHSHLVQSDLVSLAVRTRGARRITSIHVATLQKTDSFRSKAIARLVGRLSSNYAIAIATSDRSLEYMDVLGYRCRQQVINNGTPVVPESEFDSNSVVFLSLARFHPVKDHGTLLRAFKVHLETYPTSRLICAGTGIGLDNPEFSALFRSVFSNACEWPVDLRGAQEDVSDVFNEATALVISSKSETFPMVGSEACMRAVPVITTDVGGSHAFALRSALLVEPGSVADLARAMNWYAHLSPAERRVLSFESRSKAIKEFDIRKAAVEYEMVYRRVLDDHFASNSPS